MSGEIRVRGARGSDVGADLADELLRLRLRNVRLKDTTDPAEDRRLFLAWIARASWVSWCEDASGSPCAMVSWRIFEWDYRGARRRGGAFEYYFIDADARGSAAVSIWLLEVAARALWQARVTELWIGAAGTYPQSAVGAGRVAGSMHYLGEPGLGDEPAAFLERLLLVADTRASPEGIVAMRTVPPSVSAGWARWRANDASYARYLALNPRWEEGFGLVMGARLDAGGLLRAARAAGARFIKRRWAPLLNQ